MAWFHELPLDIFTEEQRPYIARLNRELRDVFGFEGTVTQQSVSRRSDLTVVRKEGALVDSTRVEGGGAAGATATVGTPALSFGLTNTVGTTTSAVSVDSAIALFDTIAPEAIGAGAASTGSAAFAARRDHAHSVSTDVPDITYGTSETIGTSNFLIRGNATLKLPQGLSPVDKTSTVLLTDDTVDQTLTSSLGILNISPATTMAVDAKVAITENGLDCLALTQNSTTTGAHIFLNDKGGNLAEPASLGNIWRNGSSIKMRNQTLQFGEDNASSTTRRLEFVNRMGGSIKVHGLQWFKNGFASDWDNATRTLDLPDGDTTETIVNATAGIASLGKPEGGIIYDGQDGQHIQTMSFKRFIDATTFFRNDTNLQRGFRFQCADLADPVGASTIDNSHGVVNIPATVSLNPSQSDMILHDVANNFTNNNTFNEWIDIVGITTLVSNPAAGTRRLHVDQTTGEISVRTAGGTLVSLEGAASGIASTELFLDFGTRQLAFSA
jgi:hypothetical protein